VEAQRRSGKTIVVMGMAGALAQRWGGINDRYIGATARLSDVAISFGSVSKVLRLLLKSVMLALGVLDDGRLRRVLATNSSGLSTPRLPALPLFYP
jgi:ABC-type protease/lipase transport system fused ATPase/permease subunit